MKAIVAFALPIVGLSMIGLACVNAGVAPPGTRLAQAGSGAICAQVISCGTKEGKRKEYATPCAAKDDGATNIAPKTGPTCGDSK
jgi:hypothetical protein